MDRERKYRFFSNPYVDCAFTRCPNCDEKTKVRKFCLVIHVDPEQLVSFNKTCKFCTRCELIIVKKREIEAYLAEMCERIGRSEMIGNDYLVMGTLDRKLHRKGKSGALDTGTIIDSFTPFVDHLRFEPRRGSCSRGGLTSGDSP